PSTWQGQVRSPAWPSHSGALTLPPSALVCAPLRDRDESSASMVTRPPAGCTIRPNARPAQQREAGGSILSELAEFPIAAVREAMAAVTPDQRELRAVLAFTVARWSLERNQEDAAIAELRTALSLVPELRPVMRLLYRIYGERNDVRNAVTYRDQEIRATRHPREAAALYRERGQLVERYFRDLKAAQQCHEAALRATPRDLAVLRSVERVSLARGDVFG